MAKQQISQLGPIFCRPWKKPVVPRTACIFLVSVCNHSCL